MGPRDFSRLVCLMLVLGLVPALSAEERQERHLTQIRQLTFDGKNAEAYFSFEGDSLIFQSTRQTAGHQQLDCYQMYTMDLDGTHVRRVSNGFGSTTCGFFFPGGRRVLFSSTHRHSLVCPPKLVPGPRYRWMLHDFDIFSYRIDGLYPQRLTSTPGYDAEATIAPNGKSIVFTSLRNGDLDLYAMDLDGTHVRQLTQAIGYDGGGFYSPDSRRIVYRAFHPQDPDSLSRYQELLKKNLVEPSQLELFIMNADGSGQQQITRNGAANFAPSFHPDGRHLIFSSNLASQQTPENGRPSFHLFLIKDDGTGLEQITHHGHFNSFPMFSPDGTQLVWISDRHAKKPGDFNVFLAQWVP